MGVTIIADSTADLIPAVAARVKTIPLTIRFGDQEFLDGITIDSHKFYEMLVERDELPTTSQATPFDFEGPFAEAVEAGADVVCITCSSGAVRNLSECCDCRIRISRTGICCGQPDHCTGQRHFDRVCPAAC